MMIKRALISVSNKTGLMEFAKGLLNWEWRFFQQEYQKPCKKVV